MQAIPVTIAGTELEVGAAKPLFPTEHNMSWTSSTDGEHFIVGREVGGALTRPTTVVMNWQAAVK